MYICDEVLIISSESFKETVSHIIYKCIKRTLSLSLYTFVLYTV